MMIETAGLSAALFATAAAGVAALASWGLIATSLPWLQSHALAQVNPRSSHAVPTPQGGGIAVVAATMAVIWGAIAISPALLSGRLGQFCALTGATVLLAIVGTIDDIRGLPPAPRLSIQIVAAGALIASFPADWQIVSLVPWWIERIGLVIALVWFINLVNFMDGIDWMTVAEIAPLTGAVVLFGIFGAVSPPAMLVAAALLGAVLGFAPFNRPVAKLFLGDVGALPIGLLAGWLLLQLAERGQIAAALILPLYYIADATLTLLRRLASGEPFWQAHRSHFYQCATDKGFTVLEIATHVFLVNLALAALALLTMAMPGVTVAMSSLAVGVVLVGWLMFRFARGKP